MKLIWRLFPFPELPLTFIILLAEIKLKYTSKNRISSALLLQCQHALTQVIRSKASGSHCFPVPLWTGLNKANGDRAQHQTCSHNKVGLWDTHVSQATLLPRPRCSIRLKSHQPRTKPKEWHVLPKDPFVSIPRQQDSQELNSGVAVSANIS